MRNECSGWEQLQHKKYEKEEQIIKKQIYFRKKQKIPKLVMKNIVKHTCHKKFNQSNGNFKRIEKMKKKIYLKR